MLTSGLEMLTVTVLFWLVSLWMFYMIIKAAVRNGILEADARRRNPSRPYADLSNEEIQRRLAEHRARLGDTPE